MTTEAKPRTLAEHVARADAYKAIGQTAIYLGHDFADYPWDLVTGFAPGGTHRLDMETTMRFTANHPSGLTFSWTAEIETRDANGSGAYHIDIEGVVSIIGRLPDGPADELREYFRSSANAVEAKAREWLTMTRKQFGDAAILRALGERETQDDDTD